MRTRSSGTDWTWAFCRVIEGLEYDFSIEQHRRTLAAAHANLDIVPFALGTVDT